jgi:glycerol-3-phosphate acyltransferase PlsY
MSVIFTLLCMILAYGAGCLNPAYYSVRMLIGKDLRQCGSGTLGARNVYRLYGFWPALCVFCVDVLKLLPILYFLQILHIATDTTQALVVFCGIIGHIYPAQLSFRGGKGLAVLIGASLYTVLYTPENYLVYMNIVPVAWAHMKKNEL